MLVLVLVSSRLIGPALLHSIRPCELVCSPFGWFSIHCVGARVRHCESVSSSFTWFEVYGVDAVGSHGTWFSVRVVCGGVP